MDKLFHPTLYNGCNYLSMLGLKLNHVSKRGPLCSSPWSLTFSLFFCSATIIITTSISRIPYPPPPPHKVVAMTTIRITTSMATAHGDGVASRHRHLQGRMRGGSLRIFLVDPWSLPGPTVRWLWTSIQPIEARWTPGQVQCSLTLGTLGRNLCMDPISVLAAHAIPT